MAGADCMEAQDEIQRMLIIVRHGERMDYTYGNAWITHSFDEHGVYSPKHQNQPESLPQRKGGPSSFIHDTPLTVAGRKVSKHLGKRLKSGKVDISHVYSSPALRCVETACNIVKGLDKDLKVRIEPGQFEFLPLYGRTPQFMTPEELLAAGYNIDSSHQPVWPVSKYNEDESREEMYHRNGSVTQEILKRHEASGGNILIVGHAASIDSCVRKLLKKPPVTETEFSRTLCTPYCGHRCIGEDEKKTWHSTKLLLPLNKKKESLDYLYT